jgi:methylmalonyl-CoA mutase N-terminal domain/subunit
VTLTAQQPDNNVVRVAFQALAAVLGGTQSLHTNSRDEALSLPTEESVTIALRTQQIVAHESGVADSVDPLAGSYLVESLTDDIEAQARSLIEHIDGIGGAVAAIEQGFMQNAIADSAYRYQQEVDRGERIVVGVNRFMTEEKEPANLLRVDPEYGSRRGKELAEFRQARDNAVVDAALASLKQAAEGRDNIMPPVLGCVRAGATVGEVSDALRSVFGRYQPASTG